MCVHLYMCGYSIFRSYAVSLLVLQTVEECDNLSKAKKAKSIVNYDEFDEDMDDNIPDSEEEEDEDELYDGVCAICDNGGQMLCCEGPCLRSFHPLKKAGAESKCTSLGMIEAQVEAIEYFFCHNCKYKQQQCFICGELGSSNKMRDTEVYSCVSATCGRFYHPKCVSKMLASGSKVDVLEKNIAKGKQFLCPIHRCSICKQAENKKVKELQFAICRRCPKSYHRKCLPKSIPFEDKNDDEPQRAWEGLIPKRILIYCRKHKIDPKLQTPKRNHIVFPEVPAFNNGLERNRIAYA